MLSHTLSIHHSCPKPRYHYSRHTSCHPCTCTWTCTPLASLESIGLTIPRPKLPASPSETISIADIAIATSTTPNQAPHPRTCKSHKHMSFLRALPLKPFLTTRAFTTTARTMAPKQEWLVILPDYTGKLAERNQVRAYVLNLRNPLQ